MKEPIYKAAVLFVVSAPILWLIGVLLKELSIVLNIHDTYFVIAMDDYMLVLVAFFVGVAFLFGLAGLVRIPWNENQIRRYTAFNFIIGLCLTMLGIIAALEDVSGDWWILTVGLLIALAISTQLVMVFHGIIKLMKK
ncbi:hypothetical protein SAMN05216480_10742 [Pustulibacterium marinum]|uniref:Uncharacterized protein n=1 Tax=Pustulibacterium marinum TaxID=1224947 RepID=A0A1I7H4C5_9FLAO|nr:hypothetical protein [Pustulibacterium marinum]SFU55538.1 hypothetical protein SAMN05216480_10742 [Pustulibacterium marinum]